MPAVAGKRLAEHQAALLLFRRRCDLDREMVRCRSSSDGQRHFA